MKHNIMRFAQTAVRVWGCSMDFEHPETTALEGINAFSHFLSSLGMTGNFEELGAKEETATAEFYSWKKEDRELPL